jgi:hypothetical protein
MSSLCKHQQPAESVAPCNRLEHTSTANRAALVDWSVCLRNIIASRGSLAGERQIHLAAGLGGAKEAGDAAHGVVRGVAK